jgi:XTP/dITP diphosphohydrolase
VPADRLPHAGGGGRPRRVVVLASDNEGKRAELAALLAPLGCELVPQRTFGIRTADETAATFIENALLKARHAARASGHAAIADDSGLVVDALGGAPGIRSARFAGEHATDADNNALLLAHLAGVADAARGATFHCVVTLLRAADDPAPLVGTGSWRGHILRSPRGSNGFGYDPLFQVAGTGRSAAELDAATKNAQSHRGQAVRALVAALAAST